MQYVALVISALLLSSTAIGFIEAGGLLSASNGVSPDIYHPPPPPPPPPTAPMAPRNLQAAAGDTQVTLSWLAPADDGGSAITGYRIYRGTASGALTLLPAMVQESARFHPDTGLSNGQPYYYQVSAVNAVDESPPSSEAFATPVPPTAPMAPRNLQAAAGDTQVTLSWLAPADDGGSAITGYRIYRGTASGALTLLPAMVQESARFHPDTGLSNGQPYYYQVSAVNAVDESPPSSEAAATPTAGITDTANPTISITSPTQGQEFVTTSVAVAGTASDDVAVERVELSTDGASWVPAIGTTSWSGTMTLSEGESTIHARAVDTSGNTATTTVTVTVTLQVEGQPTPDLTTLGIVAVVAAGAVAGVIAILLARRRKLRVGEGGRQS